MALQICTKTVAQRKNPALGISPRESPAPWWVIQPQEAKDWLNCLTDPAAALGHLIFSSCVREIWGEFACISVSAWWKVGSRKQGLEEGWDRKGISASGKSDKAIARKVTHLRERRPEGRRSGAAAVGTGCQAMQSQLAGLSSALPPGSRL